MAEPARIEGYAIVSDDGMLAGVDGVMPDSLKFEADQTFFAKGLDGCDAVVHGRNSHEKQPHSPQRFRLTATRKVAALAPDPDNPKGLLWNPAGARLDQAWTALGLDTGTPKNGVLGVVGGTAIFGHFLDRYDVFYLTRAPGALPGGVPVFPDVPRLTPEQVLTRHGLVSAGTRALDADKGVTLTTWRRQR